MGHFLTATTIATTTIVTIATATVLFGSRAEAQNYPWCAKYGGGMGGITSCAFVNYDQCMATVTGMGGFCQENNTYVPPPGPHSGPAAPGYRARVQKPS
jgi:hypothetical protein